MQGQLHTKEATLRYMLAGNARITVVSKSIGQRFTYRIRRPDNKSPHFVQLLNGPDNCNDYLFFGTIFDGKDFRWSQKAKVGKTAPSVLAFMWFWQALMAGRAHVQADIYHEGRCGRCGRALTVPESVTTGLGPECRGK